jgi:hypothetical protein
MIDDHSTDNTVTIAKEFNWEIYPNPSSGIPSGANEALRHVDCEYFLSLEQDLLLAYNWIERIPKIMRFPKVAVAQGIRYPTNTVLRKMDEYAAYSSRQLGYFSSGSHLNRLMRSSLDNTLFKTDIIKEVGGFPRECPICTDVILIKKLQKLGYDWLIDDKVISDHIKPDINYANAYHVMGKCVLNPNYCPFFDIKVKNKVLKVLLTSPIRALFMSFRMQEPRILFVYPIYRWYIADATSRLYKAANVKLHHRK